jgi:transposase
LSHPPGEAQVDYGEAKVRLNGVETSVTLFVMTLPYSGAIFVQAFPRECTETFLEGHRRAFESLAKCPSGSPIAAPRTTLIITEHVR